MSEISPMMRQYLDIKNGHKDSIVFFRLGDFYEMFFDDAKLVSEELDLTLTGKDYGQGERAPMCGIPFHSCESYISRLVAKGYKIAMCDQVENPAQAKGLVKREVVRIITPGTIMEESMLDESKNNYICFIYSSGFIPLTGIAFCDVSTGELKATELFGEENEMVTQIKTELGKFNPKEILCSMNSKTYGFIELFAKNKLSCAIQNIADDLTDDECLSIARNQFKNEISENSVLKNKITALKSVAYLLKYLKFTQKNDLSHIDSISFYDKSGYMGLDLNTVRNLELLETMRTKSKKGSLLWVLDKTKTAMGKRLMRSWVERPLVDLQEIILRQDAVEELFQNAILRGNLKESLSNINDMQRLMTKISYASANARDLKSLSSAIGKLPAIKNLLKDANSGLLKNMHSQTDTLEDVHELIESSICEEPSFSVKEGGIIKSGYSEEIDNLRRDMHGGKQVVCEIEKREREKTGISKLKIGYNRVFGYYIEVTNSFKNSVPQSYIRKQTLTNCERYITEELKNLESRIMYAKDKINDTEYKIFEEIREKVSENFSKIISAAKTVATIDVLRSLAEVAVTNNYVKPTVNDSQSILIKQGRHPVVETLVKDSVFVPNDLIMDDKENSALIITGPNMAGKSTYMRQTALMALMAQMGSFVPAAQASFGIVDNIFTRIGASDDLASGQSTFMVEMSEVADILKNSTPQSLLILDEIGRGTSTFDGMSIAKSVLEYVADKKKLGAKTLFATHYHELTSATSEFKNIKNYSIAVKKQGEDIIFLRTIIPGAADDSYGIEVAKLAGIPKNVISRAKEILLQTEKEYALPLKAQRKNKIPGQMLLTDVNMQEHGNKYEEIIKELKSINISNLTPIESINILYKLINEVKKSE